jgi:iron complex transport system ATP-binding protein
LQAGRVALEGAPADVLTEGTIAQVYGARVQVSRHPITDTPHVMVLPGSISERAENRAT